MHSVDDLVVCLGYINALVGRHIDDFVFMKGMM